MGTGRDVPWYLFFVMVVLFDRWSVLREWECVLGAKVGSAGL